MSFVRRAARAFPVLAAVASLAVASLAVATPAEAQFGKIGGAIGRAAQRLNPAEALRGDAPITTSLPDARWGVDSLDAFVPRVRQRAMTELQRTPNGGFVLQPGYWTMHTQSYCLKAGTHGPGGGDGYVYAPTRGPAEEAVTSILRNSVQHPEIAQHAVQTLLWAIIARAKLEDLSSEHKATAARLLTPQQLAALNRTALDLIPGAAFDRAIAGMPPLVRQALQAEAELRRLMSSPGTPFQELERVAVLAGMAPLGEGSRAVPTGRWSLHPDGYYVRYLPRAYSYTVTELWVPEGSTAVGREYDPATHIAVPGNTARQRLVQSGRAQARTD